MDDVAGGSSDGANSMSHFCRSRDILSDTPKHISSFMHFYLLFSNHLTYTVALTPNNTLIYIHKSFSIQTLLHSSFVFSFGGMSMSAEMWNARAQYLWSYAMCIIWLLFALCPSLLSFWSSFSLSLALFLPMFICSRATASTCTIYLSMKLPKKTIWYNIQLQLQELTRLETATAVTMK